MFISLAITLRTTMSSPITNVARFTGVMSLRRTPYAVATSRDSSDSNG